MQQLMRNALERIIAGTRRFRAALAHWGLGQYFFLAIFWLAFSLPLYVAGWGIASFFSLPLFLLTVGLASYVASAVLTPAPRPVAQPMAGFSRVVDHPVLGAFAMSTYSSEVYERAIDWNGATTQFCLSVEGLESVADVLLAATALYESRRLLDTQITDFMVKEMLPTINLEWKAPDALELSATDFLRAISLNSITIHPDKSYEFLYDDGDLLGGHWIAVHGDLVHGPIGVDVAG